MVFCGGCVRFCFVLLCVMLLTFSVSNAIRIDDIIRGTVKQIPLKRNQPDKFGFFRKADFEKFGKEMAELHNDRLKRSAEGRVQQNNNHSIIHEFELKGDNHSVAFLHWAGKKSSVIYIFTCGQIDNAQSDHFFCEDAYLWRSSDYGSTFHRKENVFQTRGGTVTINNVDFCKSNNKKVIVSALEPSSLFISRDQGSNFIQVPVGFKPHVISCNPQSDQMIIGHDITSHEVQYSTDGGFRWKLLAQNVLKHYWGYGSTSEVFLEVKTQTKLTSVLNHAHLNLTSVKVKTFDKSLGTFLQGSFEVAGRYMLVQKLDSPGNGLYVFYKENSSSHARQNFFQHARFPLQQKEEKEYKVVDATENELMVVVKHGEAFYNLYTSDETGVKFSLSLERILSNRTLIWGKNVTLVDLHKVQSLNGTYLANVVFENGYVRSVITYNKGGSWHLLTAPYQDHKGKSIHCNYPSCSLHIHIVLSYWRYYVPGVLSSSSAVGIIVAQGNLGTRLGEKSIGVFMSADGGLTWTKEFDSFYDFVIGDHGGILAAVSLWFGTKKVWYSCTEGKEWKSIPLDNQVKVYGMVTEPGETKLIVNLAGQYDQKDFQWLLVKLNFTTVLNRKCQRENYTLWSPNDERADGQCLLGQHIVYQRRKSGDCCFNGEEYEREINVTACTCKADDFDCDFGFEHLGVDEVCVATSSVELIPNPCPEGKTYKHSRGYRKVVGDRCVGGVEDALKPQTRYCPVTVIDGCKSAPCKNGGICITDNGIFTCKCHAGFTGHLCETDIDECKSPSPCKNGGTCVNEHGSYTCNCSAGFTGKLCEKDIDECKSPSPCKNGGRCVNEHGSYTCNCSAGFTGKLCKKGHENYIDDSFGKKPGNTPLLIAVSITASLVVIFLILALIYFLRRYKRLQSRYTHLRLYGDGGELRDREPLLGDETETEDEEALHPQPGGTQRYIPIPTSTEPDPYSDDELINNFQPGTLTFKPSDQNGQAPEETPNSQTQV